MENAQNPLFLCQLFTFLTVQLERLVIFQFSYISFVAQDLRYRIIIYLDLNLWFLYDRQYAKVNNLEK